MLAASGRPGRSITGALLTEAALIGGAAGVLGALVAWPLTGVLGVAFDPVRAALAIPVAVVLTVLASLAAALSAGRLTPVAALAPAVLGGRRALLRVGGPVRLGLVTIGRRPGRLAAGVAGVALGVGSLFFLLVLSQLFQGAVVGTLLGDAIAVQVRTPDLVAGVLLAVLGLIAVGVILFLGLTEDAPSYASLTASGWRPGMLAAAVVTQALVIAVLGGLVGIAVALVPIGVRTGGLPADWWGLALAILAGTCGAGVLVALLPALGLQRLPVAQLLSGE